MKWTIAQYFEIRWWQRYLRKKEVDHYLERKKAYWQRILSTCPFEPDSSDRILDAGCGPAGIFTILSAHQVDAIDPLIDQYEKKLTHFSQKQYPNTRFYPILLEDFSPTKAYDIVFCLNAINHVRDTSLAIQTLSTATATGKWLVMSIDTHKWTFAKWLFRTFPADILHPHQYKLKDYQQMLEKEGFKIIKTLRLKNGYIFDYHIIFAQKI